MDPKKPASILIVEDEVIVAIDLSQTLGNLGYDIMGILPSGEDALETLKKKRADLVLMDINLKGKLDGIETAEEIVKNYKIPIIYLTTYTDHETIARAKLTGPYGYITKSFDYHDLHTTIEMALYRNKMESSIQEKEELLSTIFKSISDAVVTTDKKGVVTFINSAAEKLLSLSSEDAEGQLVNNLNVLAYGFNKKEKQFILALLDNPLKKGEVFFNRYHIVNTEGREIPIECRITPLIKDSKEINGYVFVFNDITEKLRVEEINSRLASLVESSEDAIIGITLEGVIISWNHGAVRIFGYSEEEVLGDNIALLTPLYYPNEIPYLLDGFQNGENYDHYETIRQNKKGEILNISQKVSPILDSNGVIRMVSIIARDITSKKNLEKQLLEIEERERTRIGQDLHDSLGQQLMGISLKMKALEKNLLNSSEYPAVAEEVKEISSLVKETIHETRKIAKGLIPITLTSASLGGALSELVSNMEKGLSIPIETHIDEDISLKDQIISVQLYHIAQEAINNAVKHSKAAKITVSLYRESPEIVLSIEANGKGLDDPSTSGLGLRIMRYRANMAGGQLSIFTPSTGGTQVICRIPIQG